MPVCRGDKPVPVTTVTVIAVWYTLSCLHWWWFLKNRITEALNQITKLENVSPQREQENKKWGEKRIFPGMSTFLQIQFSKWIFFEQGLDLPTGYWDIIPSSQCSKKGSKACCNVPVFPEMGRAKRKRWGKVGNRLWEKKTSCWILSRHLQRRASSTQSRPSGGDYAKPLPPSTPENLLPPSIPIWGLRKWGEWKHLFIPGPCQEFFSWLDPMAFLVVWSFLWLLFLPFFFFFWVVGVGICIIRWLCLFFQQACLIV